MDVGSLRSRGDSGQQYDPTISECSMVLSGVEEESAGGA